MKEARQRQQRRSRASAVIDDGVIVEMVFRSELHQTAFLVWQGGVTTEVSAYDVPGVGKVIPFSADNNLLAHNVVLFPSDVQEYGSEADLVRHVQDFIHRYVDLSPGFEEVAAYYVMLTWIYDAFGEVPYLRFKGDLGSGKSRCLLTIGSLCYRPMFAGGASTVSPLFRIMDAFRGTLVMDEGDFRYSDERAEVVKILNNGSAAGFPVLRSEASPTEDYSPRAFAVFGPKIIATRGLFDDRALESRCITAVMTGLPPRASIPLSLPASFHGEARELRNKLLLFRFCQHARDHVHRMQSVDIEPRIAQIYAPLIAIINDPAARDRVAVFAMEASQAIKAARSASVEAQLLDIIRTLLRDSLPLAVKTIAMHFSNKYGEDYQLRITPRWIGSQLRKRLSLVPTKVHGSFVIPESENTRIRSLFARFGVNEAAEAFD